CRRLRRRDRPCRIAPGHGGGGLLRAGQRCAGGRALASRARSAGPVRGATTGRRVDGPRAQGPPSRHRTGEAASRGHRSRIRRGRAAVSAFAIAVPCSTSNLGSAFDAVGIALGGPRLLLRATPGGSGLRITRISGEGADRLPRDSTNRLVHAAHLAAQSAGRQPGELCAEVEVHSSIPLHRGLGSSAAAALAGALLADRLLGGAVSEQRALDVAVGLEGHPDNVVPSLRGGAQVAILDARGGVISCPIAIGAPLQAAVFIPDAELETKAARAVLPRSVSLADAVHNL